MILLDTHVVIWLAGEQERLSKPAIAAIDEARENGGGLAVSAMTLLELTTLFSKRRINLAISLESFLNEIEAHFTVIPISGRGCVRTVELPASFPKDPADRIIAGTALVEGLSLVTADQSIRRSKAVKTIW